MVGVVNAVSYAQNAVLKSGIQNMPAPAPVPAPSLSSIDFVTSGIYVDNLQNVAILEYRSSQTGEVIRQYPDQAQINAFKAAERLAQLAESAHRQAAAQTTASSDTTGHVAASSQGAGTDVSHVALQSATSAPAEQAPAPSGGSIGSAPSGASGASVSVIA